MPSRPTPPRAGPPARPPVPRSPENAPGARSEPAAAPAAEENVLKKDLGVNKLIAGAGAAATSAILGSFFGAMGTVTGAAVGSIASTVVTSVYEHSLNRTRSTVAARIAARRRAAETANAAGTTAAAAGNAGSTADPGVAGSADVTMPMARIPPAGAPGDQPTTFIPPVGDPATAHLGASEAATTRVGAGDAPTRVGAGDAPTTRVGAAPRRRSHRGGRGPAGSARPRSSSCWGCWW